MVFRVITDKDTVEENVALLKSSEVESGIRARAGIQLILDTGFCKPAHSRRSILSLLWMQRFLSGPHRSRDCNVLYIPYV